MLISFSARSRTKKVIHTKESFWYQECRTAGFFSSTGSDCCCSEEGATVLLVVVVVVSPSVLPEGTGVGVGVVAATSGSFFTSGKGASLMPLSFSAIE